MKIISLFLMIFLLLLFQVRSEAASCSSASETSWESAPITVCLIGSTMYVENNGDPVFSILVSGDFNIQDTNGYWQSATTTGDIYFDTSGGEKIGFGTSSPSYDWDVVGDIGATGSLYLSGQLFQNGVALGSSTDSYWSTNASNQLYWQGGSVGIGTNSPTSTLHVAGTLTLSQLNNNAQGTTNWIAGRPDDADGNFILHHYSGFGNDTMAFGTGSITNMLLDENGYLGLGTTDPENILSILAPPSTDAYFKLDATSLNVASGVRHLLAGTEFLRTYADYTQVGLLGFQAVPMIFKTNSTERMRILSGGYVGIGDTSPTEMLSVLAPTSTNSYLKLDATSSNVASGVQHLLAGTEYMRTYADYTHVGVFGQANVPMVFKTNATERMRIQNDGTVSIGTSTDTTSGLLWVNGGAGGTTTWYTSSDRVLKKNITSISTPLTKLTQIEGKSYDLKQQASDFSQAELPVVESIVGRKASDNPGSLEGPINFDSLRNASKNEAGGAQIGFIAQDLKTVLPECVVEVGSSYAVKYACVTPLIVEAVKELKTEKDAEISSLQSKVNQLESQMSQVLQQLQNQ